MSGTNEHKEQKNQMTGMEVLSELHKEWLSINNKDKKKQKSLEEKVKKAFDTDMCLAYDLLVWCKNDKHQLFTVPIKEHPFFVFIFKSLSILHRFDVERARQKHMPSEKSFITITDLDDIDFSKRENKQVLGTAVRMCIDNLDNHQYCTGLDVSNIFNHVMIDMSDIALVEWQNIMSYMYNSYNASETNKYEYTVFYDNLRRRQDFFKNNLFVHSFYIFADNLEYIKKIWQENNVKSCINNIMYYITNHQLYKYKDTCLFLIEKALENNINSTNFYQTFTNFTSACSDLELQRKYVITIINGMYEKNYLRGLLYGLFREIDKELLRKSNNKNIINDTTVDSLVINLLLDSRIAKIINHIFIEYIEDIGLVDGNTIMETMFSYIQSEHVIYLGTYDSKINNRKCSIPLEYQKAISDKSKVDLLEGFGTGYANTVLMNLTFCQGENALADEVVHSIILSQYVFDS